MTMIPMEGGVPKDLPDPIRMPRLAFPRIDYAAAQAADVLNKMIVTNSLPVAPPRLDRTRPNPPALTLIFPADNLLASRDAGKTAAFGRTTF